jgi:hypothetical protein
VSAAQSGARAGAALGREMLAGRNSGWAAGGCWAACEAGGLRRSRAAAREEGWQAWARKGGGGKIKGKTSFFQIFKLTQANEFKQRFEFKHSKQCTSMYAIGNTYTSLFN